MEQKKGILQVRGLYSDVHTLLRSINC